jgi:hypothetical protein
MSKMITIPANYDRIREDVVELLRTARFAVARNVRSIMTAKYWEIGRRIVDCDQAGHDGAQRCCWAILDFTSGQTVEINDPA